MIDFSLVEKVVSEWSQRRSAATNEIPREALKKLPPRASDLVWVIQGVRRCGKSTLLAQLGAKLNLDPGTCFFVNFEDPRLGDVLSHELLDAIVEWAAQRTPKASSRHFFFDEIQNVAKWEKWLHVQLERKNGNHYFITGSNAALLGGKLGTALTGRHLTIELFPFSYNEFRSAKATGSLEDYLESGGFPRAVLDPPVAAPLLREYFSDIVERDVRRHVAARSSLTLQQLAKSVFDSMGSETSLRKLATITGLSVDTIHSYVDAFGAAYLILPCPYFSFSERQRLVRPVKYYPIDLGMQAAVTTRKGADSGKRLEAAVFHRLRQQYGNVFHWKNKGEVDFVVQDGSRIIPYQVSWNGELERHKKALAEFAATFPQSEAAVFISRDNAEEFLS